MSRSLTFTLSIMLFAVASEPVAGEESATEVVVVLPKNLPLPQAHVLIYRVPDKDHDWPIVQADVARETEREAKTSLPEGEFVAVRYRHWGWFRPNYFGERPAGIVDVIGSSRMACSSATKASWHASIAWRFSFSAIVTAFRSVFCRDSLMIWDFSCSNSV